MEVGEAEGLLVVCVRVEAIFGTVDGFTVEAAVGQTDWLVFCTMEVGEAEGLLVVCVRL